MAIMKLEDEIKQVMHKIPSKKKHKGTGHLGKNGKHDKLVF
jgi:hypothetical protein